MAASTRIKGDNVFFSMKKGAAAAVVFDDLQSWEFSNEPKDDSDLTFSEVAGGVGVDWTLSITARYSLDTGSLYQYLWTNAGSEVTVVLNAKGAATASATAPAYTGTFKIPAKPGASNEVSTAQTGASFDYELQGTSDVTLATS